MPERHTIIILDQDYHQASSLAKAYAKIEPNYRYVPTNSLLEAVVYAQHGEALIVSGNTDIPTSELFPAIYPDEIMVCSTTISDADRDTLKAADIEVLDIHLYDVQSIIDAIRTKIYHRS